MPYWSFGDIAETFGLEEFASVAMLKAVVGQWAIRVFEHVDVLIGITHHKLDIVSPET